VPTPGKDLFFPPALHFLKKAKYILIVQGSFTLALQVCIYRAFIKLTPAPPLPTHSLSPSNIFNCKPNNFSTIGNKHISKFYYYNFGGS
jgi:hypothetical protein